MAYSFNIEHMARVYSKQDLETIDEQCSEFASDLWTLANLDLARSTGTISKSLNEISDIIEEIGKAAWAARKLQQGKTVTVYQTEDGAHFYSTE